MNTLDLTPTGRLWEVYKLLIAKAETANGTHADSTPTQPQPTQPSTKPQRKRGEQ